MYYEAIVHDLIIINDAFAAAQWIRSAKMQGHHAIRWISRDHKSFLYAVPDGHLDNMLFELAILRQPADAINTICDYIDSLTNQWIKRTSHLEKMLRRCEIGSGVIRSNVKLIIGEPDPKDEAYFTCSCCGDVFLGNVAYQLTFDQDAGYGLCKRCQNEYAV